MASPLFCVALIEEKKNDVRESAEMLAFCFLWTQKSWSSRYLFSAVCVRCIWFRHLILLWYVWSRFHTRWSRKRTHAASSFLCRFNCVHLDRHTVLTASKFPHRISYQVLLTQLLWPILVGKLTNAGKQTCSYQKCPLRDPTYTNLVHRHQWRGSPPCMQNKIDPKNDQAIITQSARIGPRDICW